MERLNGTLKLSGNLTGEEIPVIIKEKTVVEKDYENLDNKPSINNVPLEGNKTPEELGLTKVSDFELYKQSVDHSFRGVSESIRSVKTESKTYTDNAMEATKAYSDGKNSDLETAINETINNKNNATRAYASHLVTEERDARETADEETLAASKSYTDTAVVKEVTKGPASSLEFEGLQEGIPFPKIILTVPDEYVYEEGKTAHSINICCNNYADPDATELYSENMLVVAKSNTVEIGYDDDIKLLKQVPGKCIVGFSNEEDAAVCTLTVTGALKYEALKRIYSECWNRMDVEKDNMEGYVRGYTDTEITKCKEYTDEKISEVIDGSSYSPCIYKLLENGSEVELSGLQEGINFSEIIIRDCYNAGYVREDAAEETISGIKFIPDRANNTININSNYAVSTKEIVYTLSGEMILFAGTTYRIGMNQSLGGGQLELVDENDNIVYNSGGTIAVGTYTVTNTGKYRLLLRLYKGFSRETNAYIEVSHNTSFHTANNYAVGKEISFSINEDDYKITPDTPNYSVSLDILQRSGINTAKMFMPTKYAEVIIVGSTINPAIKRLSNDFNAKIGNINTILEEGGNITAAGNPVQIDGLQGGVPFSEMVVSGKNLLKYPYYNTTKTISGITFTDNGDGTITANGTATATASYFLDSEFNYIGGITYTISGCPKGGSNSTYKIKGDRLGAYIDDNGNGATYSFKYDTTAAIVILIYKDTTVDNIVFRPQLEYGDTPTAYEPPITGRELTVNVCGKNLLKYPYVNTTKTINGITFTDNGDGTVTANGTATANATFLIDKNFGFEKEGNYFLSGCPSGGGLNSFYINWYQNHTGVTIKNYNDYGSGIIIPYQHIFSENNSLAIAIIAGTTVNNLVFRPQLELGDTATAYEPYHGSTTAITPDSNPYVIPNDIRQQDGLNTISVSEGEISVVGVRKNAALKRVWKEMNDFNVKIGNINTILESVTGGVE